MEEETPPPVRLTMTGLENGTERAMNTFRADLCFVSALEYKYDADLSDIQNGFLRRFMTEFDQLGKDQRGEGAAHDIRNMVFDELFPKMLEECIDLDEVKPHTVDFVVKNMKFADVEYIFGEEEEMGSPKQCAEMLDAWINEELIDSDPIPQNQTEQNPGSGLGFEEAPDEVIVDGGKVAKQEKQETALDEAIASENVELIEKIMVSSELPATKAGAHNLVDWAWYAEMTKVIQSQNDIRNLPDILKRMKEAGYIKTQRDLLDSLLMAFSGEIGLDSVLAISSLFEDLK